MRFELKTQFGLLGEHTVVDVLRWQADIEVRLNTGPGFQQGFGIRYHSTTGSEVIPDLEMIRYSSDRWRKHENGEVKTKKAFAAWNTSGPDIVWTPESLEIRTGIDVRDWANYLWYAQKHYEEPLTLFFVHVLPIVQLRNHAYIEIEIPCGIYIAEISQLANLIRSAAGCRRGSMVYWAINDLVLFRSTKALESHRSTAELWRQLVAMALQHLGQEKLTKLSFDWSK
jgi:hypothetical protein